MSLYNARFSHDLYVGDLVALEFLTAVQAEEGERTYGNTTAVGDFAYATNATPAEMIAAAKLFWTDGVAPIGTTTAVSGISASTPREYYDGYPGMGTWGGSPSPGTGTWQYTSSTYITGRNFALGCRGWFAQAGYDTTLAAIYAWLRASTSNATYETATTTSSQQLYALETGTYDPNVALATLIDVATNTNASSRYDLATVGLMAPIQSARDVGSFATAKETVSKPLRFAYHGRDSARFYRASLRGKTGLGYQVQFTETVSSASRRVYDVLAAAIIGLAYRESPTIFTSRDHVEE
jgi:hypothetical protein